MECQNSKTATDAKALCEPTVHRPRVLPHLVIERTMPLSSNQNIQCVRKAVGRSFPSQPHILCLEVVLAIRHGPGVLPFDVASVKV